LSFTDAFLCILSTNLCQEESINGAPRLNKHHNTFTCGACQKRLTRKKNRDRNERKHNNDSFVPCSECGLLYRRQDNLYRHLKEKHQSGAVIQNQPVDINHPDQYYTITKEKGKKMPRFNTEFNEYRVTFNELKIQSVPDILKPYRTYLTPF
jgi:hypothetical protein